MIREVTDILRLEPTRAVVFGPDWNATINGDAACIDRIEEQVPGVLLDIQPDLMTARVGPSDERKGLHPRT